MKRFSLCAAILAISTLFTLCYTGCGKSGGDNTADVGFSSSVAMQSSTAAEAGGYDEMTATETATQENDILKEAEYSQKLTKTVRVTLETKEYAALLKELETLLQQQGGYVTFSSMENQTGSGPSYANYTMKIPQEKLDRFLESLSSLGNVSSMETQVEDITSPYYDTRARLDSLAQQEQRLLELLDQTEELQQILEIEDKLSYVRSDIEYLNSIFKTYENQVAYSTVALSIWEVIEYSEQEPLQSSLWDDVKSAFSSSLSTMGSLMHGFVVMVVFLLPYLLIAGVIIVIIILILRSSKKKKGKNNIKLPQNPSNSPDNTK